MKLLAWGVDPFEDRLRILGAVKLANNGIEIEFNAQALAWFNDGGLRPFVLVGPSDLKRWPALPADLVSHPPQAKLWANLRDKLAAKRDLLWTGWPMHQLPDGQLAVTRDTSVASWALLRPMIAPTKLRAYEPCVDGFLTAFEEPAPPVAKYNAEEQRAIARALRDPGTGYTNPRLTPDEPAPLPPRAQAFKDVLEEILGQPVTVLDLREPASGAYTQEMTEAFTAAQFAPHSEGASDVVEPGLVEGSDGGREEGEAAPREGGAEREAREGGSSTGVVDLDVGRRKRRRSAPRASADSGGVVRGGLDPGSVPAGDDGCVRVDAPVAREEPGGAIGAVAQDPGDVTRPPCAICGSAMEDDGEQCTLRRHSQGTSRVPARVVAMHGPSAGSLRVRATTTGGLRFVNPGDVLDAERCPAQPATSVWIVNADGVSYRLNEGEWAPLEAPKPSRRARSLDDE